MNITEALVACYVTLAAVVSMRFKPRCAQAFVESEPLCFWQTQYSILCEIGICK